MTEFRRVLFRSPACPVDCIALQPASGTRTGWAAWSEAQAKAARERYALHSERAQRKAEEEARRLDASRPAAADRDAADPPDTLDAKRAAVAAALARARSRHNPPR